MARFLLPLLCLVASSASGGVATGETQWLVDRSQAVRIQRVERGMPPVPVPGEQPLRMGLVEWMEFLKIPGLSVAVFDGDRIVWMKAYGVRESGGTAPVTVETTFQAGSISKAVTALAVMHFIEQGKFALDENVNDKLRSWKVPENEFTAQQKVTLRRLLSHSAGTTVHGFPGYPVDASVPTVVQVLNGEKPANTAPVRVQEIPGTRFEYSGGGTTIVQLMLVDQLGKPFPQIMADTVFKPLNLWHSSYEQPQPPDRATFSASGHRPNGQVVKGRWHVYPEMAAAGLWTTPGDLANVAIEVAKARQGRQSRVISPTTAKQMLTVQMGGERPTGLGFFLDPKSDRFGHNGDDQGFTASLIAFADSGRGVAIMTNSDSGQLLLPLVASAIAKEYGWTGFEDGSLPPQARCAVLSRKVGVAQALVDYNAHRAQGPAIKFGPGDLNECGYMLLGVGRTDGATQVFEANVALYPQDANAHDSLGEAYMAAGKKELAVKSYERSLQLNPNNENAEKMLKRLRAKN
jgi:CubicO group peptidase (beta-lactamase class C family)